MTDIPQTAAFVMNLKDVGIVSLAFLLLVFVGGFFLNKFSKEGSKDKAEGSLFENMDKRIEKLERLLDEVSIENKQLIRENAGLLARIQLLEIHEAEVTKLKRILDMKDDKIGDMEIALEQLTADKDLLEARIHVLERQLMSKCSSCSKGGGDGDDEAQAA